VVSFPRSLTGLQFGFPITLTARISVLGCTLSNLIIISLSNLVYVLIRKTISYMVSLCKCQVLNSFFRNGVLNKKFYNT